MSASGIVRRIDELGRIVIPKELRRTMRLKEGDEMEISAAGDILQLKKYSGFESVLQTAKTVSKLLSEATGADALFVSAEKVIIAEGKNKKSYHGLRLCEDFANKIRSRQRALLSGESLNNMFENTMCDCSYAALEPIVVNGDLVGACVLLLDAEPSGVVHDYIDFCSRLLEAALG